jgi:hypothetical protein
MRILQIRIQKIARRQNIYFDGELFFVWLSLWDNHAKNCGLMKYAVFHQPGVIYVGPFGAYTKN